MVTRSASSFGSFGPSEGGYGSVTTAAARPRRRKQPCPSQVRSTWSSPPSIRRCRLPPLLLRVGLSLAGRGPSRTGRVLAPQGHLELARGAGPHIGHGGLLIRLEA